MKWIPKPIAEPYVITSLSILLVVEFVRGALILSVLPNVSIDTLGLTPVAVGLAISVHYFFDNILRTPMGLLIDHFGQRSVLTLGLLAGTAGLIVIADASTTLTLTLGAAILGIGTSPLWPSVISDVTASATEEQKASAMGYIYIAWLIGGGSGPVIMNLVLAVSYRATFVTLIALLLAGGFMALVAKAPALRPTHPPSFELRRYATELAGSLKEIRVLFPGMFVQTLAIGILIPVLTPYARVVLGVNPALQSLAMIAVGGATVLLLPIMGRLVDRVGARPFLSGGFLLTSAALVLFTMQKSFWPALVFMLMLGLAYAMILPSWNSVLDRSIDSKKRGTMWGVFMTIEGLGTATGPMLGGRLWQSVSPQAPFLLSAGVVGTMGLLYLFLRIPGLKRRLSALT